MKYALVILTMLAIAAPAAAQELKLPQPTAPEPRVIVERHPSQVHYRRSPRIVLPTLRLGPGIQIRLPVNEQVAKPAFSLDIYMGSVFRFGRGARTGLFVEGGYSYVGFSEHLASAGLGVLHGIGRPEIEPDELEPLGRPRIGVVPHALVGRAYGGTAVGARTSLILAYWAYGFEVGHQVLFVGPRTIHEMHLAFTGIVPFGENE
jgi:hypothetical protein